MRILESPLRKEAMKREKYKGVCCHRHCLGCALHNHIQTVSTQLCCRPIPCLCCLHCASCAAFLVQQRSGSLVPYALRCVGAQAKQSSAACHGVNPTLRRMHALLCQTASTSRQQERRTCALRVLLHPCRYNLAGACQLLEQGLGSKLETVLQLFDRDPCRVELSQQWRPFTSLRDGQPWGPPLTRMQVLQASLAQFLRDASDVTQVGHTRGGW